MTAVFLRKAEVRANFDCFTADSGRQSAAAYKGNFDPTRISARKTLMNLRRLSGGLFVVRIAADSIRAFASVKFDLYQ
jgi:hypothetical protein